MDKGNICEVKELISLEMTQQQRDSNFHERKWDLIGRPEGVGAKIVENLYRTNYVVYDTYRH